MATPVEAPKLGNTVEECIVSKWRKQKGESVSAGEVVVDIETDKATFELPSPVDGTLLEIFFEEGALVPVFTNLFVVGAMGETVDEFRPGASIGAPSIVAEKVTGAVSAADRTPSHAAPESVGLMTPRARRFAEEHNFHPSSISGSGPAGRV